MRGFARCAAMLVVLAGWMAAATPAAACSCLETTAADYVGKAGFAIFSGTALQAQDLDVPFLIDEWFQGPDAAPQVLLTTGQERMPDGVISADTCGRTLMPGAWLVFATRTSDGRYDPGGCSATASLDEAEGLAALATVRTRLAGEPPPTLEPAAATPGPESDPGGAALLLYVVAPIALGALVFVVLVAVARRRGA